MTKTLYLMRHGETLFNQLGLIQGWCDSPLTTNGKQQAQAARDYFILITLLLMSFIVRPQNVVLIL